MVSGDFYWAHNNKQKHLSIWAVADCTGHGVPGAFMSMLGIGFLNEIIIENGISDPGEILNQLRIKIVKALTREDDNKTKDGMDISLCVWDKNANSVSYAGANNPLWIIRDRTIEEPEKVKRKTDGTNSSLRLYEIAPDKMPIGFQLAHPPPFTTQKTTLHPNDLIILFTDGFTDQFGGEKGKKFKYIALRELLINMQSRSIAEHEQILSAEFETWRGDHEQIDDVCLVGIRV